MTVHDCSGILDLVGTNRLVLDIASRAQAVQKALRAGSLSPAAMVALSADYCFIYKDGPAPVLGHGRPGAAEMDADDDSGVVWFTVTTNDEDRDGDIVLPKGRRGDNYAKNPVWFFGHQEWAIPVGTSRHPRTKQIMVEVSDAAVRQACCFDREDPDGDFVYGKVKRGILGATSIAFVPLEARRREDVEKARTHGKPQMPPGWLFLEWDHTETSIVGVPSNAGAVRDILDSEKSFTSPRIRKCLGAYAAQAKGCWGGWCPCPEEPVKKSCSCDDCQEGKACGCAKTERKDAWLAQLDEILRHTKGKDHAGFPKADLDKIRASGASPRQAAVAVVAADRGSTEYSKGAARTNCRPKKSTQADLENSFGSAGEIDRTTAAGRKIGEEKPVKKKPTKQLSAASGTAGGYTVDVGDDTAANDTAGFVLCPTCGGDGGCPECDGSGDKDDLPCAACGGSGDCADCAGVGHVEKRTKGKKMATRKNTRRKATKAADEFVDETPPELAAAEGEDEEAPPEEKDSVDEPFNPKPSALVLAKLYKHLGEVPGYLENELGTMDHPGISEALKGFGDEHVTPAMDAIKAMLSEHHGDGDDADALMDKHVKALEVDAGGGGGMETGEENKVDVGEVPPDTVADDAVADDDDVDKDEGHGDGSIDEILERYQDAKGHWQTKVLRTRVTKDGRRYVVREKAEQMKVRADRVRDGDEIGGKTVADARVEGGRVKIRFSDGSTQIRAGNEGVTVWRGKSLVKSGPGSDKALRIGECPLCESQWGPSDEEYARENGKCPDCEGEISGRALEKVAKSGPGSDKEDEGPEHKDEGRGNDTDEILERYQDAKGHWKTKVLRTRVTKDGRRYVVREKADRVYVMGRQNNLKFREACQQAGVKARWVGDRGTGQASQMVYELDGPPDKVQQIASRFQGKSHKGLDSAQVVGTGKPDDDPEDEGSAPFNKSSSSNESTTNQYGVEWRIPGGKSGRKWFSSEQEREKFVDQLVAKEGDDVDVRYSDPRKSLKSIPHPYVEATKDAADFLDEVSDDDEVPKGYRSGAKAHAKMLGQVHKALTSAGKTQRDGGPGSTLTDEGTSGNKGNLTDKGELQGTSPGGKTTSIADGPDGTKRSPMKSLAAPPALVDRIERMMRRASEAGILRPNGSS